MPSIFNMTLIAHFFQFLNLKLEKNLFLYYMVTRDSTTYK